MKFKEQQENSSFEQKFVTGPITVNNVLINPTLDELKKWGVGYMQNEPVYTGTDDKGFKYVDIIVWAKEIETESIINWRLRLTNKVLTNSLGDKTAFINDKGSVSWAANLEALPEWFKTGGTRKALQGEEEFYSFITAFNNIVFKKDEFESIIESPDSLKDLFAGKFNDLKFANTLRENKLKVINGITERNDKFYNQVYTKQFFKHWDNKPYLYESKEKKGGVTWEYFIDYLTKVDTNSRYNPLIITSEPKVWTLAEVKKQAGERISTQEPTLFTQPDVSETVVNDLPF